MGGQNGNNDRQKAAAIIADGVLFDDDNRPLLGANAASEENGQAVKPASNAEVDAVLFKRALQRDIQAVVDHEAETQTIYNEALRALAETANPKTNAHYRDLESKDAGKRETAQANIKSAIETAETSAKEELELAIDRVALGVSEGVMMPSNGIANIWDSAEFGGKTLESAVRSKYGLQGKAPTRKINPDHAPGSITGKLGFYFKNRNKPFTLQGDNIVAGEIKHHTDVIKRIKKIYEDVADAYAAQSEQEGVAKAEVALVINNLEADYNATINKYYAVLKTARGVTAAESDEVRMQRAAYERKRAQHEMAQKQEEQRILSTSLKFAKYLFATSMGFFSAGGWLALVMMVPGGPAVTGVMVAATAPFLAAMFFFSARMNWLTTNNEMGPLFTKLFFNPAHAGWGFFKRLKYVIWQSEISVPATIRTLKGGSNLVAASLIGFLTFLGSVSLLTLMMSQFPVGAALTFGTFLGVAGVTWPVLVISAVLATAATLIYFVISNVFQHDRESREHYNERMNKLGKINGLGEKGGQKVYAKAIAASLLGIGTTLLASFSTLAMIKGIGLAQTVNFAAGALSVSVPVFGLVVAAVLMIGFYGISSFYIHRTRNTAQNKVCDKIGGRFDGLKSMAGQDVTGREAPDLKEVAFGDDSLMYSTNENKIGSSKALLVNSVGQAGQSIKGGVFTFMPIGAAAGGLMGGPIGAIVGAAVGALAGFGAGVAAGMASYNANSVGSRQVKHRITEVNTLAQELDVLNRVNGIENKTQMSVKHGEAKAEIEHYKKERAGKYPGHKNHYGVTGFKQKDKLEAADELVAVLDNKTDDATNDYTRACLFTAYGPSKVAGCEKQFAATQGTLGKLARDVYDVDSARYVQRNGR